MSYIDIKLGTFSGGKLNALMLFISWYILHAMVILPTFRAPRAYKFTILHGATPSLGLQSFFYVFIKHVSINSDMLVAIITLDVLSHNSSV
jgi:hypothetical protein